MAAGDILAVRIASAAAHNGWVAEIDLDSLSDDGAYTLGLGTNNDPSTAKIVFTVTSPTYDATGASGTGTRTVYGTYRIRKAYPDQADADETEAGSILTVRVALSEFIYSGDTVTASIASGFYTEAAGDGGTPSNATADLAVTNNSTLTHPKVIGRWAWPGYERITSADFLVEFVAFHRSARNKKPLACVKITAIGETSAASVTKTVTDMTVSTRTGDANAVLVYAATFTSGDWSAFTQAEIIRFKAEGFPWVGDADAVFNTETTADGFAQPDERGGPLYAVLDKTGDYGSAFAVVDPVNGNNSSATTWTYASQAEAEAAYAGNNTLSYASIGRAAAAAKAYNNALASPRNEPGGGTALLIEGNHSLAAYVPSDLGAMNTWYTVTKLSTASQANVIINVGKNGSLGIRRIKYAGITAAGSTTGFFTGSTTTSLLWLHANTLNITGSVAAWTWQMAHATQNTITSFSNGFSNYGGVKCPWALLRGNTSTPLVDGQWYAILGNANVMPSKFYADATTYGAQPSDNSVVAFNTVYGLSVSASSMVNLALAQAVTKGVAIVQNIFEAKTGGSPIMQVAADSSTSNPANNILIWHNTMVGQRLNAWYNDINLNGGSPLPRLNESLRGNLLDRFAIVSDVDTHGGTADGVRVGNWSARHGAGFVGNVIASWAYLGEFSGLNTLVSDGALGAYDLHYVSNKSGTGTGAGGGDYHLTADSEAGLIPAGCAVLPFDIEGTARRNAGSGAAGAYEYGSDPSGGGVAPWATRRQRTIGAGVI